MPRKRRRESRAQRRDALLRDAMRVDVPSRADVCVVGGGAAGLVAGIVAAESGAHVVVLERDLECGRTILATGNGRCNFVNRRLDPASYNDPAFVGAVCDASWLDDVLGFFRECGLAWAEEAEGRLYPLSRQAASVRNVLLARARRAGVLLAPAREVIDIRLVAGSALVRCQELHGDERCASLGASSVVLASGGGMASFATNLELSMRAASPVLCPLACTGIDLAPLDGRRVHTKLSLRRDGHEVAREHGEVLFRDYGVSGIAAFNLSRHALAGDKLVLDLLPGLSVEQAVALAAHTLDGVLDPTMAKVLLAQYGSRGEAVAHAKRLELRVEGPAESDRAQVSRGGLSTDQFSPATLEAHDVPGVYACGEALDVDGPCGGFNLAWAWKSGMVAGRAAAQAVQP